MSDEEQVAERYAELTGKRDAVRQRVGELEAEMRAAGEARAAARAALVEAERTGARPAERAKAEKALADAELKPGVLGAKIEGARAAVHDADVALARFVHTHLTELVAPFEQQGELVKAKIDAACEAILTGIREREAIAQKISGLASMTGRVQPGDVSRSRCEPLVREAARLIAADGECPPTLDRDPRQPRHGEVAGAAA